MTTAGEMRERVGVLSLVYDREADEYRWAEVRRVWARAELDSRSNLFSSVGIGARGVTFTLRRRSGLDLHHAFAWRGRHCFLTAVLPDGEDRGYQTVKAALCQVRQCQKDADKDPAGSRFPGVLTEKYVGHDQPDIHGEVTTDYVLVTPKSVTLAPGSWVTVDGAYYRVLEPHTLDEWKNEFEVRRREDC